MPREEQATAVSGRSAPRGASTSLSLRIDLPPGRLGPGKVALLEAIAASGSISGAGRAMTMSYRRAWLLVDSLNAMFRAPLVEAAPGGAKGGGARLTALGQEIVARYRAIERSASMAARDDIAAIEGAIRPPTPDEKP
jgi:molybdate transport system regulatory protein